MKESFLGGRDWAMFGGRRGEEACVSQTEEADEPLRPGSTAQKGARGGHFPHP